MMTQAQIAAAKRKATHWDIVPGGDGFVVLRTKPGERQATRVFSAPTVLACRRWAERRIAADNRAFAQRKAG
jgi:hypothetical protein